MINKPKGTYDICFDVATKYNYIRNVAYEMCEIYNYKYIQTPVFESSELFHRSVGESSDIVTKETYDFTDRSNRSLTLRPEGTAGVVRSYIENKMYGDNSLTKLFYMGSMYRYERPQAGRNREFNQFGIEAFGSDDYSLDVEVLLLGYNFLLELGLDNFSLKINCIGDKETKDKYSNALKEHFASDIENMCEDCKQRYEKNPLRILDCKVDKDNELMKSVPAFIDYLSIEEKNRFDKILKALDELNIDYEVDNNLVRGLDYYTGTVFEFVSSDERLGANSTILGGGRYNNLVKELDGPSIPAIGMGCGIERLMLLLDTKAEKELTTYLIYSNEKEKAYAVSLLETLRNAKISCDMNYMSSNIKTQYKMADKLNSKFYIICDEELINNAEVKIKSSSSKKEEIVNVGYIEEYIYEKTIYSSEEELQNLMQTLDFDEDDVDQESLKKLLESMGMEELDEKDIY